MFELDTYWAANYGENDVVEMMRRFATRLATCKEHFGEMLPVEVATHNSGSLLFESGAVVSIAVSFDVQRHTHPPLKSTAHKAASACRIPTPSGGPSPFSGPAMKAGKRCPLPMTTTKIRETSTSSTGALIPRHSPWG
ncbi:MAG: hypothetical protein WCO68_03895 [Verrucomicrobiota bacterium]